MFVDAIDYNEQNIRKVIMKLTDMNTLMYVAPYSKKLNNKQDDEF